MRTVSGGGVYDICIVSLIQLLTCIGVVGFGGVYIVSAAAAHDLFRSHALQQLRSLKIELALLYDVNVPLVVRYEGHAAIVIYDPSRIAPFKRDKRLRPFSFRKLFSPGQLYIRQPACQRSDKYK